MLCCTRLVDPPQAGHVYRCIPSSLAVMKGAETQEEDQERRGGDSGEMGAVLIRLFFISQRGKTERKLWGWGVGRRRHVMGSCEQ